MSFTAGSKLGKYLLERKLGQGSFGLVFVARDTQLDREVAIKLVNPSLVTNPEVVRRFVAEARSAAKIVHPGIVTVYECGEVANVAYIAMELLHGESLADRLARSGRLTPDNAGEIGRQIASALEAAHRAGVVHRDLKPDNIFLMTDPAMPERERIKVLDFGIAKLAGTQSSAQTQSMMVFGTPRYMSPEQCRSAAHVDHRSDIYTLGCILFELVVGSPPFNGAVGDVLAKHLMIAPPTVRSAIGGVPEYLDELIAKMLAKDPAQRPQSMAEVQQALEAGSTQQRGIAPTVASLPLPPLIAPATPVPTTLGGAAGEAQGVTPARRKVPYVVAAVAGAVLGLVLLARRDTSEPAAASQPESPAIAIATPVEVELVIASNPPAAVYLADQLLGETPYSFKRPASAGQHVFVLRAKGHHDLRVAMRADASARTEVTLVEQAKPVAPTTKRTSRRAKPPAPAPTCDAEEFERKGQRAYVAGKYALALTAFDSAYQCKPSTATATKMVMAACNAGDVQRARLLWRVIPAQSRKHVIPVCTRNGIAMDIPSASST